MEHGDYTVGWICALPTELAAAEGMLDKRHTPLSQVSHDHNIYTLGQIGVHNVAIACLPSGVTGTASAAIVATHIRSTFPSIRFGLMVGVGGGAPSEENDIRLGDVVISKPTQTFGGVVQYDFGKTIHEGRFERTGSLNRPPDVLLNAVSKLQARHMMEEADLPRHLSQMLSKYPKLQKTSGYQGAQQDHLFEADYDHRTATCDDCESDRLITRSDREDSSPTIHYGIIASGNQVMRDGATRERLRKELNVLCFEMEAAGLMDNFPCLVIRGICDYADTHKNKRWQPYAAAVAAAYAKELLCIIPANQVVGTRTIGEASAQGSQPNQVKPVFTVPFRKDPKFVDREFIFSQIEEQLHLHHCASLSGIGGIGYYPSHDFPPSVLTKVNRKSQIVIEYAYRFRQSHPQSHVFWIYAASTTQFMQAYQDIARKLRLPGCEDSNIDPCELVSNWLDEDDGSGWLMILDNADSADLFFRSTDLNSSSARKEPTRRLLFDYIPKRLDSRRSLIITTRNRHLGESLMDGEPCIEVLPFSIQEADSLLRLKAKEACVRCKSAVIRRLLEILGYIPLAITQAGAYIKRNRQAIQGYLTALETNQQNLTDRLSQELQDPRRPPGFPNAVFRTWNLSFDQILAREPQTAKLLSLIAMLDPQRIPEKLLRRSAKRDVDFEMAIGTLDGFALISQEIGEESYAIHPLVQASVHYWLEQRSEKADCASQALQLLVEEFPTGIYEHTEICELMLAHAQAVLCYKYVSDDDLKRRAKLLYNVGWFSWRQGRYVAAHREVLEAYNIVRERSGELAFDTLSSLSLLAAVLMDQVKYKEAEKMHRRALKGMEKLLGFEHPNTLVNVNNLAVVLRSQRKYKEAEKLYRRALKTSEKVLEFEHPDTLISVNNLAVVFQYQGKYKAAEELHRRALEERERVLGVEHPRTLTSVNNLAVVLQYQGKYKAVEELYRRALEGREKMLGVEHPETLKCVHNLAALFHKQQRYNDASVLYLRASAGFLKTLGPDHPTTWNCSQYYSSMIHERGNGTDV